MELARLGMREGCAARWRLCITGPRESTATLCKNESYTPEMRLIYGRVSESLKRDRLDAGGGNEQVSEQHCMMMRQLLRAGAAQCNKSWGRD